jgi:hypothetical protein
MTGFTLTDEQQAFLDAAGSGPGIVCQAGAGAGKTTVAKLVARKLSGQRGIYTAFNKAIVMSAAGSMPRNVQALTTYKIAWNAGGYHYKRTLDIRDQRLQDVARILGVRGPLYIGQDLAPLGPTKVARHALATVEAFCASADPELTAVHVPEIAGAEDARAHIVDTVLPLALNAWDDMSDPRTGKLRSKPGLYFKRWALTNPEIDADFLMVDEVQDTDPVLAGVLRAQKLPMYLIGDDAQMIYGWRGCVSVMSDFPHFAQLQLTQSFRFGDRVAEEANKWLELIDAAIRLRGNPAIDSTVGPIGEPRAILCRTNAEAVVEAMECAKQGRKVHLKGAGDEIQAIAKAAAELQAGNTPWHDQLQAFRSWGDVVQYVEDGMASTELEAAVRLIEKNGIETVVEALEGTVAEPYADVVITTTHKVKGLEWPSVRIANDWDKPKRGGEVPAEFGMLAYVAVTRAQQQLDRGGLSWIDGELVDVLGRRASLATITAQPAPVVELPRPAAAPLGPGEQRAADALREAQERAAQPGYSEADRADDVRAIIAAYLNSKVGAAV